jgi:hypothetical protein
MTRFALAAIIVGTATLACGATHAIDAYNTSSALRTIADVTQGAIYLTGRHASEAPGADASVKLISEPIAHPPVAEWVVIVGDYAGTRPVGSFDILLGDHTQAPDARPGFVNFGNKVCYWRDTGRRVACPPLGDK